MCTRVLCLLVSILTTFTVTGTGEAGSEFEFQDPDTGIEFTVNVTTAFSEVSEWEVNLNTSSVSLSIDSLTPISERGFWIVGFISLSPTDIYEMFSKLGQLKRLDYTNRSYTDFCTSLPYFYDYTISDLVQSHSPYQEEEGEGDTEPPVSVFNWRLKPLYKEVRENGHVYNKTTVKAMAVGVRTLLRCQETHEEVKGGSYVYKKTLYHTYIRIKEWCVNTPIFYANQCIDIFERTSVIVWSLTSHILVMSSVSSEAMVGVAAMEVTATSSFSRVLHYTNTQGSDLLELDVSVNLNLTTNSTVDYYLYLPDSFNITGPYLLQSEGLYDWNLTSQPNTNLTRILNHFSILQTNLTQNINGIYQEYLAEKTFPVDLFKRDNKLTGSFEYSFKVTNELKKASEKVTIKQVYLQITCHSDTCSFGSYLYSVATSVSLMTEAVSWTIRDNKEVDWTTEIVSVTSTRGTQIVSLQPPDSFLYNGDNLNIALKISPNFVFEHSDLRLLYLTLTSVSTENPLSYLIYKNTEYQYDMDIEDLEHIDQLPESQSYGRFGCLGETGVCTLNLTSGAFTRAPTGDYTLKIALLLVPRDSRRRRATTTIQSSLKPISEIIKLHISYNSTDVSSEYSIIDNTSSDTSTTYPHQLLLSFLVFVKLFV